MRWLVVIMLVVMSAHAAPKKVRNAALLFMPAVRDGPHRDAARRQFQPLLCSIDGKLVTGVPCADLVPARAVVRVVGHDKLTINRAKTFEHPDDFPTTDFPSPYAPACCNYKGCSGKTTQYDVAPNARKGLDDGAQIAVWPSDADVAIELGTAHDPKTMSADQLLITTDIDHDGVREHIVYTPDINNYGIAVTVSNTPLYSFGCGDG